MDGSTTARTQKSYPAWFPPAHVEGQLPDRAKPLRMAHTNDRVHRDARGANRQKSNAIHFPVSADLSIENAFCQRPTSEAPLLRTSIGPEHDDLVLGSFDTEILYFRDLDASDVAERFLFLWSTSRIASWMISVYRPMNMTHCTATDVGFVGIRASTKGLRIPYRKACRAGVIEF